MTFQDSLLQSSAFEMFIEGKENKSEAPDERVKTLPSILVLSAIQARSRKNVINEMKNDYFLDVTL